MKKTATLGKRQLAALEALRRHDGIWYPGCGWIWDTRSGTIAIMNALIARGLVRLDGMGIYRITPEGIDQVLTPFEIAARDMMAKLAAKAQAAKAQA